VNPALKYALARIVLFVACVVPALLLLPREMNTLLKIMVALVVSAGLSFVLLKGVRTEVAEQMSVSARRRIEQKQHLRSALSGDDEDQETNPAGRDADGADRRGDRR
jgi:hypothetical protein